MSQRALHLSEGRFLGGDRLDLHGSPDAMEGAVALHTKGLWQAERGGEKGKSNTYSSEVKEGARLDCEKS